MTNPLITIITPTTGKQESLSRLIESINIQDVSWSHILLWDDKRDSDIKPHSIISPRPDCTRYSIVIPGSFILGSAAGSALRAVGMIAANTPYVTFADSDVWYEKDHLKLLLHAIKDKEWSYTVRRIWANEEEYLGEDRFESIGDDSKLSYKLVDNSSLLVTRKFASSAACLYRETEEYNDDRLMFAFLKKYAGNPGKTNVATVNQICPTRLEPMFRKYCTK